MAKYYHIIALLLFLLTLRVVQCQHQAPARGGAERLSDIEAASSISPRSFQSEHYALDNHTSIQVTTHLVNHLRSWTETSFKILANTSCTALLSTGIMQLVEKFDSFVDYANRTYRFLKASGESRRAIQNNSNTSGTATGIPITQGSATQQAPSTSLYIVTSRTEEFEKIAAWAGLRLEEVPLLALRLEGTVWRAARIGSTVSEISFRRAQHRWRRIVTGFQKTKLVLGFAALWRGCFPDPGTAACQQTLVAVMVVYYLATIQEWVDSVYQFFAR